MSSEELLHEVINSVEFDKLKSAGLINQTRVRNIQIEREFRNLRKVMRPMDAIEFLANKYFRSVSTIQAVVYRKRSDRTPCR